jgi:hypothetical protein
MDNIEISDENLDILKASSNSKSNTERLSRTISQQKALYINNNLVKCSIHLRSL